jgi:periplasmic nitrate reductase NapE
MEVKPGVIKGSHDHAMQDDPTPTRSDRSSELKAFLFLTVVTAPVLAGIVIGTYGLAVWIYQVFAGPPGS